jgi:hypothetical protein
LAEFFAKEKVNVEEIKINLREHKHQHPDFTLELCIMPGFLKYMKENLEHLGKLIRAKKLFYPVFLVDVSKNLPMDLLINIPSDQPVSVILLMSDLAKLKALEPEKKLALKQGFVKRLEDLKWGA